MRRLYTPQLANKSLPLVRRIAADVKAIASRMQDLWPARRAEGASTAVVDEFDELRERFAEHVGELEELGVELKDPLTGLLDFRARREDGQVVYLCWHLGEDAVGHWHTLDGGFAGRQPLEQF